MGIKLSWQPASVIVLILMLLPERSESANILAVFPFASRSHDNIYSPITKALSKKGHTFTVITSQPLESPPPNYKQIDFNEVTEKYLNEFSSTTKEIGILEVISTMRNINDFICEKTLFHPEVNKLIHPSKTSEQFDLILTTAILGECFYGFAHVYKVPIVLVSPPGALLNTYSSIGIVAFPSYIGNMISGSSDHMTFLERIVNTVITYGFLIYHNTFILSNLNSIMKKAYGEDIPPFHEIEKYINLVLVNHHFSLNGAHPLSPNLIEVGGIHINPSKDLPKHLKEFMDDADKDGVIYVSFGSILKSANFPVESRDAFIAAFSELKQRILWKWEGESPLPGQSKNVRLEKWLPQQDVLSHPNVKLFITHGGLLSMQEAASRGVPLMGIPFYGDQFSNLKRVEELQIGVKLDSKNLTKENILFGIRKILGDSTYQTNMKVVKAIVEDQKEHPLDRAVYWIEYVLRHKGAKHMQLASVDLRWYQLYMLDVLFVLVVMPILVFSLILYVIIKLIKMKCKSKKKTQDSSKKNQ